MELFIKGSLHRVPKAIFRVLRNEQAIEEKICDLWQNVRVYHIQELRIMQDKTRQHDQAIPDYLEYY